MQHSVCGIHFSSCGTVHVDSRWQWKSQVKSYISENDPESTFIDFSVDIWLLGSYEDSMFTYGTPRTQRAHFQSILRPLARVVFSAILVPRDPFDNSEMCVHARSLVRRLLTQTGFLTSDITYDPCKWTNTVSETGIEPSCVEIGPKLISVDWKVSTTMVMTFPTLWLRFLRIFPKTDTWLYWRNFGQTVCPSICQSNTST